MLRTAFSGPDALAVNPINVYGVLSVVFWALVIIVTLKYITLIMRADNNGEGGILALTALVSRGPRAAREAPMVARGFGIFGARCSTATA
jgi:KUP system potassium uptake protein